MSGPKRGRWRVRYDPTPRRVADLRSHAAKLDVWLQQHDRSIADALGEEALCQAHAARAEVSRCISAGDPDEGFAKYGQAWSTFNRLYDEARQARRRRQLERRQREQRAASQMLADCRRDWDQADSRQLLSKWADSGTRQSLESRLRAMGRGSPENVQEEARAWQRDFEAALERAREKGCRNATAVEALSPMLQEARRAADELDASVLPDPDGQALEAVRRAARNEGEAALTNEDIPSLRAAISKLSEIAESYAPKVRAAQHAAAVESWRAALANCGYSVSSRQETDGVVVLTAGSFPMKTVTVEVRSDTDQVGLEVNGTRDHTACVKDVQSLQTELGRQGIELTMTDWGREGRPVPTRGWTVRSP